MRLGGHACQRGMLLVVGRGVVHEVAGRTTRLPAVVVIHLSPFPHRTLVLQAAHAGFEVRATTTALVICSTRRSRRVSDLHNRPFEHCCLACFQRVRRTYITTSCLSTLSHAISVWSACADGRSTSVRGTFAGWYGGGLQRVLSLCPSFAAWCNVVACLVHALWPRAQQKAQRWRLRRRTVHAIGEEGKANGLRL